MLLLNYWKSILMLAVILFLSFMLTTPFEGVIRFSWSDKVVHLFIYCVFALIIMFDHAKSSTIFLKKNAFFLICIAFPVFIGGITEIMQSLFFESRQGEWLDFAFNNFGVLLALLFFRLWQKIKPEKIKEKNT